MNIHRSVRLPRLLALLLVAGLLLPATAARAETVSAQTGVTGTTTVNLRMRQGPGTTYLQLGLIPTGRSVPVVGRSADSQWVLVEYNGLRGWSAAWFMTFSGDLNSVPVSGETGGAAPGSNTGVTATTTVNLRVRSGPGTTFGQIGLAPSGTTVSVLGRNADATWILADVGPVRGWMAAWFTLVNGNLNSVPVSDGSTPAAAPAPAPAASGPVTATTTVNLRLRQGPDTTFPQIGLVPPGTALAVQGRNSASNWVFVDYNGTKGWLAAWYCTISGDLNTVAVTGETGTAPAAAAPAPAPTAPIVASGVSGSFELGGQTHSFAHPDLMRAAGMTWVKFQQKWSPGSNPGDVAGRINNAHAQGFKVLISVPGPLYPSSIDFAAYTEYMRGLASLGPDAIEVWNEQNLNREWPSGQVSPASYVNNMLAPAYNAIKSTNPNVMVIAGALAPTGVNSGNDIWSDDRYVNGMRDAGASRYMDCLGVHHNAGATSPYATSGHPAGTHYSWYLPLTHNVYAGAFPGTKLCYTELGYLSGEGYPPIPATFAWAGDNTVAEHAQWLGEAATILRNTGQVRLMIVFNVDFTVYTDDPQAGYAILRPDGSCPACGPLAAAVR